MNKDKDKLLSLQLELEQIYEEKQKEHLFVQDADGWKKEKKHKVLLSFIKKECKLCLSSQNIWR